jgi:hypothetical protein
MTFAKFRLPIMLLVVLGAGQTVVSCTSERLPTSIPPANPAISLDDPSVQLPAQQSKGLLAVVTFHSLPPAASRTHSIDLRLINQDIYPKTNLNIDQITLDYCPTYFRSPPSATLWNRGSSVDYPDVAGWNLPNPPPRSTLVVRMHYENTLGRPIDVLFKWELCFDAPIPVARRIE